MFNEAKGYGFVKADCAGNYFVHCSEIVDKGNDVLVKGDRVEFAVGPGTTGKLQAVDVRIVE